jgi:preprotein translocase subunit YajC
MNFLSLISAALIVPIATAATFAQGQGGAAPHAAGGFGSILPMMILMFVIIYFLMIRPEQKKQKDRQEMMKNLKKGDKVVTAGGITGIVGNVKEDTVMVKIAENTVVEFTRSAVNSIVQPKSDDKSVEKTADKETSKPEKK